MKTKEEIEKQLDMLKKDIWDIDKFLPSPGSPSYKSRQIKMSMAIVLEWILDDEYKGFI